MPVTTKLRKQTRPTPGRQEEEEADAPARRPLQERVEAGPALPGRPYRVQVENETDRMFREMLDDLRKLTDLEEIPLPEHPDPQHPFVGYTVDRETGHLIPGEDALIRGDYVYLPEDGSRITRDEFIRPWRRPGVIPTANDLMSRGWDACYSLYGEGSGMRLAYHWLSGLPGEPRINMRMDRFFSPGLSPMHFSPRPPVRAEASATQPVPEPARQPAGRTGYPPVRAEASATRPLPEPGRQPAARTGHPPVRAEASATRPVPEPGRQPAGRTGYPPVRAEASATRPVPEPDRQPAGRAGLRRIEIPLPDHPAPKHPPIYYTLDPVSGRPIPERNSIISCDYVREQNLNMVYERNILPWREEEWPSTADFGCIGCITRRGLFYTLEVEDGEISILIHDIPRFDCCGITRKPLDRYHFAYEGEHDARQAREWQSVVSMTRTPYFLAM